MESVSNEEFSSCDYKHCLSHAGLTISGCDELAKTIPDKMIKFEPQNGGAKDEEPPPTVIMTPSGEFPSGQQFTVERVVARRFNQKKRQFEYLVKWEGNPPEQNTWESTDNMVACSHLVKQYEDFIVKNSTDSTPVKRSGSVRRKKIAPIQNMKVVKPKVVSSQAQFEIAGRPVRSSKQKAMDKIKYWCGTLKASEEVIEKPSQPNALKHDYVMVDEEHEDKDTPVLKQKHFHQDSKDEDWVDPSLHKSTGSFSENEEPNHGKVITKNIAIPPSSPNRPFTLCPVTGKRLMKAEGEKTPEPTPPSSPMITDETLLMGRHHENSTLPTIIQLEPGTGNIGNQNPMMSIGEPEIMYINCTPQMQHHQPRQIFVNYKDIPPASNSVLHLKKTNARANNNSNISLHVRSGVSNSHRSLNIPFRKIQQTPQYQPQQQQPHHEQQIIQPFQALQTITTDESGRLILSAEDADSMITITGDDGMLYQVSAAQLAASGGTVLLAGNGKGERQQCVFFTDDGNRMMQNNQNQEGMMALVDFGNSVGQSMPHQLAASGGTVLLAGNGEGEGQQCVFLTDDGNGMMQNNQNQEGMMALDDFGNSVGQLMPHQFDLGNLITDIAGNVYMKYNESSQYVPVSVTEQGGQIVIQPNYDFAQVSQVAQIVDVGEPTPGGGPRKLEIQLPDGNIITIEMDEEQFAALEKDT